MLGVWWKGLPAVDQEKGSRRPRKRLPSTEKRQPTTVDGSHNWSWKVLLTSATALFSVNVNINVDHPALCYLVNGRRPFYSPFHHALCLLELLSCNIIICIQIGIMCPQFLQALLTHCKKHIWKAIDSLSHVLEWQPCHFRYCYLEWNLIVIVLKTLNFTINIIFIFPNWNQVTCIFKYSI